VNERDKKTTGDEMTMATSENLKRLASTFTVRDIMVSAGDLVCATGESDAASVSKENPDFSFIPIKHENRISAYYPRDADRMKLGRVNTISI
jgi:hypothetical protein